ncbi:hypothetical protein SBY92_001570 [Candida maltosa Xu316]|uniref:Vacuolar membrane protein n=1 Tax=Candida maltosa (strain Xu316) TaxID=1245528 RepID=M3IVV6_CANMX|nr:hypothetical protein G210_0891 [Candida maltosa Xu316]
MPFQDQIISITLTTAITTFLKRDDATTSEAMPTAMPTLTDPNAFTTPSISVPPTSNNPFIIRQTNPSGTVFIAVGAIVGAILLGFILYHLIVSLSASRLAKRSNVVDKNMYEKYQTNNNNAYGFSGMTPQSTLNNFTTEYGGSVSKLPLLNRSFANVNGSQAGDNSTIYQSEVGAAATSKHDLTKMFVSPTAEVMQHKRVRSSHYNPSLTNLSFGGSTSNLVNPSPATNRHAQAVPSLYINQEGNNSDYSLSQQGSMAPSSVQQQQQQQLNTPSNRRTLPSMYLEDLIDKE